VPDQPWLDGIDAGKGVIPEFVAIPLGMGYTVEGQITEREDGGGLQIIIDEPKPGGYTPDFITEPRRLDEAHDGSIRESCVDSFCHGLLDGTDDGHENASADATACNVAHDAADIHAAATGDVGPH
jgi:hypothetical protein